MTEYPSELQKLIEVATSVDYPLNMRNEAVDTIGRIGTHDALQVLLEIAGNDNLVKQERERALKQAMKIVKNSH